MILIETKRTLNSKVGRAARGKFARTRQLVANFDFGKIAKTVFRKNARNSVFLKIECWNFRMLLKNIHCKSHQNLIKIPQKIKKLQRFKGHCWGFLAKKKYFQTPFAYVRDICYVISNFLFKEKKPQVSTMRNSA